MSVEWAGYEPYVPPTIGPLHELTRKQARQAYEHLMAGKASRVEALRRLLTANGVDLSTEDAAIQKLNDWLRENVEPSPEASGRLRSLWYAVVNDVALFLGDALIQRSPGLRWELFTAGKRDVSYQRHVLVGFSKVPNPKYNVDIDLLVATYAQRVVEGLPVAADEFLGALHAAGVKC